MIDIHAHILPFVDDGSDSLEKSLEMLRKEVELGVTDVVCTPHFRAPYTKTPEELKTAFEDFKKEVADAGIKINLHLGQEICVSGLEEIDVKEKLKNGELLTVNDSKWVLIEFDFTRKCEIVEMVYELRNSGYIPIVAHLERYFYADDDVAYEIKVEGGYIQVNAGSLVGKVNRKTKKFAKELIKQGFVDFVASDVHSGRSNYLKEAYEFIQAKFGIAAAEVTCKINPKKMIKG